MSTMNRRSVLKLGALGGAAVAVGLPSVAWSAPAQAASLPTYLTGVYAPVPDEISAQNLTVEGRIPPELRGRYFRNGPNPEPGFDPGIWWRGAGMVHGIRIADGKAQWYRNRWTQTSPGLGELRGGAANTSIKHHAGKIMALYETALPYQLTPDLETVGPMDFGGKLTTAFTAHPKTDPRTGEMHFFGYAIQPPYATYHRLSARGELIRSVPIDLPEAIMMHDFAITEHNVLWLDFPVVWNAAALQRGFPNWSDTHQARIGVMPKDGTSADIRWYPVHPRWGWHVGNAYEDRAGRIVLHATSGDASDWAGTQKIFEGTPDGRAKGRLYEWALDPRTGQASERFLTDVVTEFPTINDGRTGEPNRYVYSPTTPLDPTPHNRIVKNDTVTGAESAHYLGAGQVSGEAVFVPARHPSREDDGWLITIVHDLTRPAAALVILDASAPAARPVATVHLPRQVPYGYHGEWIDDAAIGVS